MRIHYAAFLLTCCLLSPLQAASGKVAVIASWRELTCPQPIAPLPGAIYYTFPLENGTTAHLVVTDLTSKNWLLKPGISTPTRSTSDIARQNKASAAINGGYFNLSDGVSASYVVIDGKEVGTPQNNRALVENAKLKPHLLSIFARAEIRFLVDKSGKQLIQIAGHNEALPANYTMTDTLQAGPRLLPHLTAEEEAFRRTEPDGTITDSIGTQRAAARTAFGITNDNYAIMLTVAGKAQEDGSSGLTLAEVAELMKHLGCVQAINLDGGASTTMYAKVVKNSASSAKPAATEATGVGVGSTVCGKHPETRVKSILMLKAVKQ